MAIKFAFMAFETKVGNRRKQQEYCHHRIDRFERKVVDGCKVSFYLLVNFSPRWIVCKELNLHIKRLVNLFRLSIQSTLVLLGKICSNSMICMNCSLYKTNVSRQFAQLYNYLQ